MGPAFTPYPFEHVVRSTPPRSGRAKERIVIVGGGIAGLSLALGLAAQGIRSVVVEADATVCTGSRAICFSRRSLEIFQRIGVLEPVLAKGLAWEGGRSYYRDREVLHFRMPNDDRQELPPMINLQQYHVEEDLVRALAAHAGLTDVRWGSRVTRVEVGDAGVRLAVDAPGGGYEIDADWVVACDGGRSHVREALGLRLQGTAYEGRYVVVDIALQCDLPTERLAWFDPPSNPGSTILMHRQPDGIWRIDYQLRDDEDGELAVLPDKVLPRVAAHLEMMGLRGDWSPVWITLYRANALTLERYRHGRVLFVGDAAHLVPIFGVRGANSTIDDADNLAWKLGLVATGQAGERLLDSYDAERVHAARVNLDHGRKSTEFMAPPDAAYRLMREAALALAVDTPALRPLINPRQSSPICYDTSPLNATEVGADGFVAGPAPGSVLPSCPVTWIDARGRGAAGFLSRALLAGRFTLLHFSDVGPLPPAWIDDDDDDEPMPMTTRVAVRATPVAVPHADLTVHDVDGSVAGAFAAARDAVYLVRPDGHVLGRWPSSRGLVPRDVLHACLGLGVGQEATTA